MKVIASSDGLPLFRRCSCVFFLFVCSSICLLGNRTLVRDDYLCAKTVVLNNVTETTVLWKKFCGDDSSINAECDEYFLLNNITEVQGIPGVASGVLYGESLTTVTIS